jgi:tetratricopeptide (TPR) repeat protein
MQLPRTIAIACLFAVAACSSSDESPLSEEERIKLHREYASKFFATGDYAQAEHQANLGLALDDDEPELLLIKGWVHVKRGKSEDVRIAERIFRDLADAKDYRTQIGLGEALERKGVLYWESAAAVESGERSTQAKDRVKRAEELRADAKRFWRESVASYNQALKTKPDTVPAINGLQRVCALQGEHAKALEYSFQLLELERKELDFWRTDLARPNISAAQETEMRRLLAEGERLMIETHLQASSLLVTLARKEEALEQLDSAAALAPQRAEIYSRRSQLRRDLGQLEGARADIEEFLRRSTLDAKHPDVKRALEMRAEFELALGGGAAAR